MPIPERWDLEVDVAVLGSGASATTAAILAADNGAEVALLERAETVGGTTAISGGVLWLPNNHHMAEAGIEDSREDALAYLDSLSLGMMDAELVETLIDTGPEMLRYMEENTPVSLHVFEGYPDYHPENPGGKPQGGRSLDALLAVSGCGGFRHLLGDQLLALACGSKAGAFLAGLLGRR